MHFGVSYVVPVYNKVDCLGSVLRQIRRQSGDIPSEYIFVDDGSTDGSLAMIRRKTRDWPNTTIQSQSNKGAANATNCGVALASMEYIKFVDADDLLTDNATLVLLRALRESDACLAFGDTAYFSDESALAMTGPCYPIGLEPVTDWLMTAIKGSLFNPSQCLARSNAVKEVGGCDERIVHSQEYSLSLRLARRWPILRVSNMISFMPINVKQRLSDDVARQLQRVTRAVALFLDDHPDIPKRARRYAARRAASRAWRFSRRKKHATICSVWFWRYVISCMGLIKNHSQFIEKSCGAFDP